MSFRAKGRESRSTPTTIFQIPRDGDGGEEMILHIDKNVHYV